jgi:hypothetical protein
MSAIHAVCIRNTAGNTSIPGKIGTILSERSSQTDTLGRIHARIRAGIEAMQAVSMRMSHGIVTGKKDMIRKL